MGDLSFLQTKKALFESALKESFNHLGAPSKLKEACEYALTTGGKRFRPLLVLAVAEALGKGAVPLEAALSVEYFHTASLIADDLPCMDNDEMRRGHKCVHIVFGEAIALLSSYALITGAFEWISRSIDRMRSSGLQTSAESIGCIALKEASTLAGIRGATMGQYLDLFSTESDLASIQTIFHLKTVTLFEISFLFGWLFGGGALDQIERVRSLARHFGMAFQLADDIRDFERDKKRSFGMNIVCHLGMETALSQFLSEMNGADRLLAELHLDTPEMVQILALLRSRLEPCVSI